MGNDDDGRISIVNWDQFQHYKNRTPPWIKLHRSLLENREWTALPDSAARLLPELWLLASETEDGTVRSDSEWLSWRLRRSDGVSIAADLTTLRDSGFIELEQASANKVLAMRSRNACPEGETETEGETEERQSSVDKSTGASADVEKSEDDDWRALLAPAIRGIAFFCKDPPPGQTLRRNMSRAKQLIDAGYSPEMLVEAIKGARRMAARRVPPISGFIGPTDPFGVLIFDRDGEEGAKLIYTCASYYRSHGDEEAPVRSGTLERISA